MHSTRLMRHRTLFLALLLLLLPLQAFPIVVGELQSGGTTRFAGGAPITVIGLSRPVLDAAGVLESVDLVWTGGPPEGCDDAFKLKFFRPQSGGTFGVIAERGPFIAPGGTGLRAITIALQPPVPVVTGDLIGYTQMKLDCGGVAVRFSQPDAYAVMTGDPPVGNLSNNNLQFSSGVVPSIRARGATAEPNGYLPVVGSTAGSFGALFKTSAQLTNRGNLTITGRLVFHPLGTSGTATDPGVNYSIPPNRTLSFEDIVAATGTTGLGSMDLYVTSGYPPDLTVRIFDDHGTAGTAGLTEELMTPYQAMRRPQRGTIAIPPNLDDFRLNIGVRTLQFGATISVSLLNAAGTVTREFTKTYPSNWFEQLNVAQFLGVVPEPNGMILISVDDGSLFVYGALTDNRTNDPNIRFPSTY